MSRMVYYDSTGNEIFPEPESAIVTTHADNLPLMLIDDLAALCASPCPPDQQCGRNMCYPLPECVECWKEWLGSPVEVET